MRRPGTVIQVNTQRVKFEIAERARQRFHANPDHPGGLGVGREAIIAGRWFHGRFHDIDRPHRHRIRGAKAARSPTRTVCEERSILLNQVAGGEFSAFGIDLEARDRHRRHRITHLWIEHAKQRGCDLGKLRIHLMLDSGRQQCERFDEALHMRVRRIAVLQLQAIGNLGIFSRIFPAYRPKICEFLRVVVEQILI